MLYLNRLGTARRGDALRRLSSTESLMCVMLGRLDDTAVSVQSTFLYGTCTEASQGSAVSTTVHQTTHGGPSHTSSPILHHHCVSLPSGVQSPAPSTHLSPVMWERGSPLIPKRGCQTSRVRSIWSKIGGPSSRPEMILPKPRMLRMSCNVLVEKTMPLFLTFSSWSWMDGVFPLPFLID